MPDRCFPTIHRIRWFNLSILVLTPLLSVYGILYAPVQRETVILSFVYYAFSMFGITAGYHRLYSHRSYIASLPLQIMLLCAGASAVQGSCYWWSRRHRAHHRHTDTDQDPYDSNRGLLWTHIGWMLFDTDLRPGPVDSSDLRADLVVQQQHKHIFPIMGFFGFVLPTLIAGIWGDWLGGFLFVGALRLTLAHHSTFCINSIAHYLGTTPYDDKQSPRDHLLSALLTMGEGYHNFHHQFPMDYRNAVHWYGWDPTKWFIALCYLAGLASQLRTFPKNEIEKGALSMQLKTLKDTQDSLHWPVDVKDLPVISWDSFQEQSKSRTLLLIAGFIHDATSFVNEHPGGVTFITQNTGKDVTAAFFGGVYSHSNAAHNLLSMRRVGVLHGGVEVLSEHSVTPGQKLYVATR